MKRTIFITDMIGSYCGMHYYDEAFTELLRKAGYEVRILSTFSGDAGPRFFPLIFNKNKVKLGLLLLYAYLKFVWHQTTHRNGVYIYMCYGEAYDLLMLTSNIWNKHMFCDVHEVHALKYADNSRVSGWFASYYKIFVRHFIYHSDRTKDILEGIGVKVPMLYVPHFRYVFKKSYEKSGLSDDIAAAFIDQGKVRFLFFGNLSIVKGVDLVTDVFGHLSKEQRDKVELVIAGKNVDGMDFSSLCSTSPNFKVFDRHINDDEMVYLYSRTDYVLLPYRKSSQSGIFAMAAYFRKPMLMTDIPYFRKMMTKYPSFGRCVPECGYGKLVEDTIMNHSVAEFYTREDCDKSDDRKQTDAFMNAFNAMLE